MKSLDKFFAHVSMAIGIAAIIAAMCGATHQLACAGVAFAFYIVARWDAKKESKENK